MKKSRKKAKLHKKKRRKELLIKGLVLSPTGVILQLLFPIFLCMDVCVYLQTETEIMTSVGFLNQLIPDSWRWENYLDVFGRSPLPDIS